MDVRVNNTKNRIYHALTVCMQKKSLIEMYDKDIINAAEISPRTFYKYYENKVAVLHDMEKQLIDAYQAALKNDAQAWKISHSPSKKDILQLAQTNLTNLLNYFANNRYEILALISDKGDPAFNQQLIIILSKAIEHLLIYYFHIYHQEKVFRNNRIPFQIVSRRYAKSDLSSVCFWLRNYDYVSVSQLKKIIGETIIYSPYELTTHRLGH